MKGTVLDAAGGPVAGALVTVDGAVVSVRAAGNGTYSLVGVPSGSQTLRARVVGYSETSATVTVPAGGTVEQNLTLTRNAVSLAAVAVVVGSRAIHKAADEVAVPVDVISSEVIAKQGTSELSAILQNVSPSVNFPRQSVTDADDIVRPFTMRGLSPDHSLVLVNGVRRHRSSLIHTFAFGMPAGSTGVDLNAFPSSAIDRMEILRDGASAQYGSDAIAGVLNLVIKDGTFSPFVNADFGRYFVPDYPDDGNTVNLNGGWGRALGKGSLSLFAEYRNRQPTNRAWPEAADQVVAGDADEVDENGKIITKNNAVPQPNHHAGDGLASDLLTFVNLRVPTSIMGSSELYAFGGFTHRTGTGNGFFRQPMSDRNWPEQYPLGFLPEFNPTVQDASAAGGLRGEKNGWNYDASATFGHNLFDYDLRHTLNVSLGPCFTTACAPGVDGILGNADDPGIPNSTEFYAGGLRASELGVGLSVSKPMSFLLPRPINVAAGISYRRETFNLVQGEKGSWVQGGHLNRYGDPAPAGSQVFSGFLPSTEVDEARGNTGAYLDLETNLASKLLVNVATRYEDYSDFGSKVSNKLALRLQPTTNLVLRGAASTGFRAPSLAQTFYGSRITNFRFDDATQKQVPFEVGIFPVADPIAVALGAKALVPETSVNLSAGLAWTLSPKFHMTLDGYQIDLDDRILLTGFIGGDSVAKILANQGLEQTEGQYFTNIVDTRTTGVDLATRYSTVLGAGALNITTGVNYTTNEIVRQRPQPSQLDGTDAVLVDQFATIQIEKERPDWRGTLTTDYMRERTSMLVRASYYGQFHSAPGLCETCDQTFPGRTLIDVEAGYQFSRVRWALGSRNLFNAYPGRQTLDNGYGIFPWAGASPFGYNGRFVYTRAEMVIGK